MINEGIDRQIDKRVIKAEGLECPGLQIIDPWSGALAWEEPMTTVAHNHNNNNWLNNNSNNIASNE